MRLVVFVLSCLAFHAVAEEIDFNRQIRPILANRCFACHGPDEARLEAGLRLDEFITATRTLDSGTRAIAPGKSQESEMLNRISSTDPDLRMPPASFGKSLTENEVALLRRWIDQGANYAKHWSYVPLVKQVPPEVPHQYTAWPRGDLDRFALAKMLEQGMRPSPEADRATIARRVFLDLIGLPPTIAEIDAFLADPAEDAYERLVDGLLRRPEYGEHWARQWLDLARYADSAGYADDPMRAIWGYRDWVIRAFERNLPFDQFTVEQLAGDLLPQPTEEQLIATAFHRNTMTNNEGGTNDEEFRNVAVVDRVNTTYAVWMGTTMACAQCHSHKYDPLSQEEYFQSFAIFNNCEDADKRDESPILELFTTAQRERQQELSERIERLQLQIDTPTEELSVAQRAWEAELQGVASWTPLLPINIKREREGEIQIEGDSVFVPTADETDTYTMDLQLESLENGKSIVGLRVETLPDERLPQQGSGHGGGNFVISRVKGQVVPNESKPMKGRYVRIELSGKDRILSLAEVQVFSGEENLSMHSTATQSSTGFAGTPELAIDGNTDGNYQKRSVTHTELSNDPWWELDLGKTKAVDRLVIWNRTDNRLQSRLGNFRWSLLDEERKVVVEKGEQEAPDPSVEISLRLGSAVLAEVGSRDIEWLSAVADFEQSGFMASNVIAPKKGKEKEVGGWGIGGSINKPHQLTLTPKQPLDVASKDRLRLVIEQQSKQKKHLLGKFRIAATGDQRLVRRAKIPEPIQQTLDMDSDQRDPASAAALAKYFRDHEAVQLATVREELAKAKTELAEMKPTTTVPILRELAMPRKTELQYRGNYLDKGPAVAPGVPSIFHPIGPEATNDNPKKKPPVDRLAFAKWLVARENPLTARVLVNRYWETLFGRGIVVTSEEFGTQGEGPTHPELLDWLADDLVDHRWDLHHLLKRIVTSATYRQSSRADERGVRIDRDNRWLARGPRIRLTAEMVRDQALAVSGLLSKKRFGPPVKPPQPNLGLTAAFGSSTDWQTSEGEDRYRRAIYTTWRRSNPYPSMATFDAPNREVCTVRRTQTNTPLQSLVTLNDPVFVEAAQGLARRAMSSCCSHRKPTLIRGTRPEVLANLFRTCLLRNPSTVELDSLTRLYQDSHEQLSAQPDEAKQLAMEPLGALPEGSDPIEAAALTVVCNVLLNLDEMLFKP